MNAMQRCLIAASMRTWRCHSKHHYNNNTPSILSLSPKNISYLHSSQQCRNLSSSTSDNTNIHNDDEPSPPNKKRPSLASYKTAGLARLEKITDEVVSKSKKSLFAQEEAETRGPTIKQRKTAHHLYKSLNRVLDRLSRVDATFNIDREPIGIESVEVSPDLRHARVYWSLPYTVSHLSERKRQRIQEEMQRILDGRGAKLQTLVTAHFRSRRVPKMKFVVQSTPRDAISRALFDDFL